MRAVEDSRKKERDMAKEFGIAPSTLSTFLNNYAKITREEPNKDEKGTKVERSVEKAILL